jgi:CelD/BcsL family acetyltransferase involved in cellulose biosynthesis
MSLAYKLPTQPSVVADMRIELSPLPSLPDLALMWQELEARADRSFFLSWTWIGTWLKTIDCRPKLLIARMGDRIVGLALVHTVLKTRHRIMPVRTMFLNQTGNERQDIITIEHNDILVDRYEADAIRRACLRFLIDARGRGDKQVDELMLGGIDDPLLDDIKGFQRPVLERASCGSAFVDLNRLRRLDIGFLDGLSGSTARRIKRSLALYREHGELELQSAANAEEALDFFEKAGEMHQARWTTRGHPGAFAYPFFVMFHRRLIRTAVPDGRAELIRISVGGEPLGYLYNFIDRGRVSYYFSGFRFDEDNRLKPGLVCHALCIDRHLAAGRDVYDFMGGDQRYKLELGRPGPRLHTIAVQLPNWKLAAERPLRRLKRVIGSSRSS